MLPRGGSVRLTSAVLLVVGIAASALAAGPSVPPAAGRENVIVGMAQEPNTVNPLFAEMAASLSIMATLFTSDVQRDNTWRLFPQGVSSLPTLRAGTWALRGSGMTLSWKVKPRMWHDGRPVSCGDYLFTHALAKDDRVPVVVRDLTRRIANINCTDRPDRLDIVVEWGERYAYANQAITEHGALPRHILEPLYRQNPQRMGDAGFGNDPKLTVGDGRYRFVEWRKGSSLTVEAVPNHPIFGTPAIKRVTWRFIPDTNSLVANMLAGSIDAISTIGISFDQAVQLERLGAGRFKVFFEPGLIWEHIDFNLSNPLLKDIRVRRAIAHAVNRATIVQQLFQGRQPVSHTYLPTRHPGYTDRVDRYAYDPERARRLLQEAGFFPDLDRTLRNAAGQRLVLELNTTAGNRLREQIAQIIQEDLRRVGIALTIKNYPARVLLGDVTNKRSFPGLVMYAWILAPTSDCDSLYTSDGIPRAENGWSGQNYPGYVNPAMDARCKAASREIDEGKRNRLLNETAVIFSRDLPALPLYVRAQVAAAKAGLQNFVAVQLSGTYETWNVHRWVWE
jgi:peptide/nickel transport system substrate-binding protein